MAALDFRTATAGSGATVTNPAGTVAKDLVLVAMHVGDTGTYDTPAGWTYLGVSDEGGTAKRRWYARRVESGEPASWTFTGTGAIFGNHYVFVYERSIEGAFTATWDTVTDTAWNVPAVTATDSGRRIGVVNGGGAYAGSDAATPPAGWTARTSPSTLLAVADVAVAAAGTLAAAAFTGPIARNSRGESLVIYINNSAPNAPILVTPIGGAILDLALTQRFDWDFSDPDTDPADTQSQYELRYKLVGAGSWTTVGPTATPNTYHDFAGGTFAAGDYEWQARTYDALGLVGPWSASEFFTAASAPAAPSITAPANGSTISAGTGDVTWSAPAQSSYQVRKVADSAGSPDTATVYYDSGEVVSASLRTHALTFPVNSRWEHIQVRIKASGLWSSWASVRVQVSYTVGPTPTVAVTAVGGSLTVAVTNPAPGASEPAISYNDIYIRIAAGGIADAVGVPVGGDGIRVKTTLAGGGTYVYEIPASDKVYEFKARAVFDNGTTADSAWAA